MYRKNLKNEPYTERAKKEGYPARSVYKLKEIDEKYKIFKKGDAVLDLGCSPGSWLLYISEKIGEKGKVLGIDIEDIKIRPEKNITFLKKNIFKVKNSDFRERYNAVVSDLAPKTSGIKFLDNAKSFDLSKKALGLAKNVLKEKGNFVCKTLESEFTNEIFRETENSFLFVKRFRPKATMKNSKEIYIVAKGFKKTDERL